MRDKDIQKIILDMAPLEIQEDWDNSGWQIRLKPEFSRVMIALDIRKDVIEEAIREGCDLIVTHHPLLFDPLRS
ncbi:MAG: Nif3-like dinuclear metal center hexameric protein, partial [Firmicutes bacterium]|nr:Nif3-like dinuclear metal center hexameric protein [Bacillota bacterium]